MLKSLISSKCYHCGLDCPTKTITIEDKYFCCDGCKLVYEIIHDNNLDQYYSLNNQPGNTFFKNLFSSNYEILDNEQIVQALAKYQDDKIFRIVLNLPQIHCSSCLYLLENLTKLNKGIISSHVYFERKECDITFEKNTLTLRQLANLLQNIGYAPNFAFADLNERQNINNSKAYIYKIGIAGFCFSNIMMLSLPVYLGLDIASESSINLFINIYSYILAIPVLFYCASEFFKSSYYALRSRTLNIEIPIALALVMTFIRSVYELFTVGTASYLDSMSGIVFFMLIGRWMQNKTLNYINFDRDYKSFWPVAINTWHQNQWIPKKLDELKVDDLIKINSNQIVPVDASCVSTFAKLDYSFVTGESQPVTKQKSDYIFAGAKNLGASITLRISKEVSQSYLTQLWNNTDNKNKKEAKDNFVNKLNYYFTFALLLVGFITALYWLFIGDSLKMWDSTTTILIVACPCTLLLASSYTRGFVLSIFNKNEFYLKNALFINTLAKINHIVFDKTGTLTQNEISRVTYHGETISSSQRNIISSILQQSDHPLSTAVFRYLNPNASQKIDHFKIIPGNGIEAWYNNDHYKIGSAKFLNISNLYSEKDDSTVYIAINNRVYGHFLITNAYREGIFDLLNLRLKKISLSILSGDHSGQLHFLKSKLRKAVNILFEQTPEDKKKYILKLQDNNVKVMMIGDGLNDVGALKQSDIGVALAEDKNSFTPESDAVLSSAKLTLIPSLIAFARYSKSIILFCFVFSFLYNFTGLYFAVQGILSPLIAALLMPISSLSIIFLTFILTKLSAKKCKLAV